MKTDELIRHTKIYIEASSMAGLFQNIYTFSPVSLQSGRPLSSVFGSQVSLLSSIQVNAPPPARSLATGRIVEPRQVLTAIGSRGNAATTLSIDVANILLQAGIGCAASAVGDGAIRVNTSLLRSWRRERDGCERKSDGECELHVAEVVMLILR